MTPEEKTAAIRLALEAAKGKPVDTYRVIEKLAEQRNAKIVDAGLDSDEKLRYAHG